MIKTTHKNKAVPKNNSIDQKRTVTLKERKKESSFKKQKLKVFFVLKQKIKIKSFDAKANHDPTAERGFEAETRDS